MTNKNGDNTPLSNNSYQSMQSSYTNPDEFNTETSPTQCEVCNSPIPPNRAKCNTHRNYTPTSETQSEGKYEWNISHVALAVISAKTALEAVAKASSSFKLRDNAPKTGDSFDLIYDFDNPSRTLTSSWGGELPDATPLSSKLGTELFKHAKAKSPWNTTENNPKLDYTLPTENTDPDTHIFTEFEGGVRREVNLNRINPEKLTDSQYWVIPAVLYTQKRKIKNEHVHTRSCHHCNNPTKQIFEGVKKGEEDKNAKWTCLHCKTTQTGTLPQSYTPEPEHNHVHISEKYTPQRAEQELFEEVMSRLEDKNKLNED